MGINIDDKKGICLIEGKSYPAVGFGTYLLYDEICVQAVIDAANCGYRIIDTATSYGNLKAVGDALKQLDRSEYYVISKVWHDFHSAKAIAADMHKTLQEMQIDYLDAYFLHWPNSAIPIEESLHAMQKFVDEGKLRHIGLSNVTVNHLKRAFEVKVPISWVQIEMHPLFCDFNLLEFCQHHSIAMQAWAPIARGRVNREFLIVELGKKYGKTAVQVALRWIVQHGCLPLPGSHDKQHIEENLHIMDFQLSKEEMEQIDQKARRGERYRFTDPRERGFTDEFDFSYEQCWPKQ